MAVATDNTVSGAVSIFNVFIVFSVSTAPLNRNGTQTVNILEPTSRLKDIATLQAKSKERKVRLIKKKNLIIFFIRTVFAQAHPLWARCSASWHATYLVTSLPARRVSPAHCPHQCRLNEHDNFVVVTAVLLLSDLWVITRFRSKTPTRSHNNSKRLIDD